MNRINFVNQESDLEASQFKNLQEIEEKDESVISNTNTIDLLNIVERNNAYVCSSNSVASYSHLRQSKSLKNIKDGEGIKFDSVSVKTINNSGQNSLCQSNNHSCRSLNINEVNSNNEKNIRSISNNKIKILIDKADSKLSKKKSTFNKFSLNTDNDEDQENKHLQEIPNNDRNLNAYENSKKNENNSLYNNKDKFSYDIKELNLDIKNLKIRGNNQNLISQYQYSTNSNISLETNNNTNSIPNNLNNINNEDRRDSNISASVANVLSSSLNTETKALIFKPKITSLNKLINKEYNKSVDSRTQSNKKFSTENLINKQSKSNPTMFINDIGNKSDINRNNKSNSNNSNIIVDNLNEKLIYQNNTNNNNNINNTNSSNSFQIMNPNNTQKEYPNNGLDSNKNNFNNNYAIISKANVSNTGTTILSPHNQTINFQNISQYSINNLHNIQNPNFNSNNINSNDHSINNRENNVKYSINQDNNLNSNMINNNSNNVVFKNINVNDNNQYLIYSNPNNLNSTIFHNINNGYQFNQNNTNYQNNINPHVQQLISNGVPYNSLQNYGAMNLNTINQLNNSYNLQPQLFPTQQSNLYSYNNLNQNTTHNNSIQHNFIYNQNPSNQIIHFPTNNQQYLQYNQYPQFQQTTNNQIPLQNINNMNNINNHIKSNIPYQNNNRNINEIPLNNNTILNMPNKSNNTANKIKTQYSEESSSSNNSNNESYYEEDSKNTGRNKSKLNDSNKKKKNKIKSKQIKIVDLENSSNIVAILKDRAINKSLQELITIEKYNFDKLIFTKIQNNVLELCDHQFANYIIQKLIPKLSKESIKIFYKNIKNKLNDLTLSIYGTRVIQILLKHLEFKDQEHAFTKLISNIDKYMRDSNGFHVIISMIEEIIKTEDSYKQGFSSNYFKSSQLKFSEINDFIVSSLEDICYDKYGCCFIQKYLSIVNPKIKKEIIKLVLGNAVSFLDHVYANYVIQYIITLNNPKYSNYIIQVIKIKFYYYAKNKSTSNVIEKLLELYDDCDELIDLLIDNEEGVKDLVLDCYGNYVYSCMINYNKSKYSDSLLSSVTNHLDLIVNCPFGVNFLKTLINKFKTNSSYTSPIIKSSYMKINNYLELYSDSKFEKKQKKS